MGSRHFRSFTAGLLFAIAVAGCSSHSTVPQTGVQPITPTSVSPASRPVAPMAKTQILPASVMQSAGTVKPMTAVQGLAFTQLPGSAVFVAAAPDGSLWALSGQPAGNDKYIWHYVSGTWTNIAGLASRLSVGPSGTLYAINSGGGTFSYSGGTWTALGGGARDLSAAADGSLYVISNGGGADGAIWRYSGGTWTQQAGSGNRIATNWDTRSHIVPSGTITPGGFYVVNSGGLIFYKAASGYIQLSGQASEITSMNGGIFVLTYPLDTTNGNAIFYYDLDNQVWSARGGSGGSISTDGSHFYVTSTSSNIYTSAVTAIQHLYVGNDNAGAQVFQYTLPLTSGSTSNFTLTAGGNVVALATDANGNLAVGLLSGQLQIFPVPLSGSSTASATFSNAGASNNGQAVFTNNGDFWAANVSNRANNFAPPFTNSTTLSAFVTDAGMVSIIGAAMDPAGNLYLGNAGTGSASACVGTSQTGGGCGSNVYVYAPPYTGAPTITPNVINFPFSGNSTAYRKFAANSTRLYADSVANGSGRVDVWNLPITSSSTPAFALTTGVNTPEGVALDASGNLYIGNLSDATITVYTAPITASSVPSLIYKVSTGAFAIFGVAVGP